MSDKTEWEQGLAPVGEVLAGLRVHPLEDGDRAVAAYMIVKVVDADDVATWVTRRTGWDEPSDEELLGLLTVQREIVKREAISSWADEGDE